MKLTLAVALLLLVAFCFAPVARNSFVNYDDDTYVTANPLLEGSVSLRTFRWAFTTFRASNWHPLTWISHQADVALFGFDPRGHLLTSLALHATNTLLIFLLLLQWTGATGRSAFAAALFGVHPLHVESVAWVAERKDVLSTLFFLLTLLAYGRYAARRTFRNYSTVALLFTLGLLAKPMLVTLPLLLLVLDFWPLGRLGAASRRGGGRLPPALGPLLGEKLPLMALAAVSGLVTLAAQTRGGAVKTFEDYPLSVRLLNAVVSAARYLEKTLWPKDLAVFYPHPGRTLSAAEIAVAALLLAAITLAALHVARRRPYVLAGWGWYLLTLSPVLGIVQVGSQAMADRYTYIPLAGLFVASVWIVADLAKRWGLRRGSLAVSAALLVLSLSMTTRSQVRVWRSGLSLFEHALAVTGNNYVAHDNLASELERRGRTREAMRHALEALRIRPDREPGRYLRFGRALMAQGMHEEAVEVFEKAVTMHPADPSAARLLAAARAAAGSR
jgi:hypothetical protein